MGGDSIGDGRYVLAAALGEGTFGARRRTPRQFACPVDGARGASI